eukprot:GFYU01005495.1.p1 GENE.GFYU01005495.1~~GFYU01005495.1.p1  ORF type:complete len:1223 (+),score=327.84 GFYU01005495.1:479-4147(+)
MYEEDFRRESDPSDFNRPRAVPLRREISFKNAKGPGSPKPKPKYKSRLLVNKQVDDDDGVLFTPSKQNWTSNDNAEEAANEPVASPSRARRVSQLPPGVEPPKPQEPTPAAKGRSLPQRTAKVTVGKIPEESEVNNDEPLLQEASLDGFDKERLTPEVSVDRASNSGSASSAGKGIGGSRGSTARDGSSSGNTGRDSLDTVHSGERRLSGDLAAVAAALADDGDDMTFDYANKSPDDAGSGKISQSQSQSPPEQQLELARRSTLQPETTKDKAVRKRPSILNEGPITIPVKNPQPQPSDRPLRKQDSNILNLQKDDSLQDMTSGTATPQSGAQTPVGDTSKTTTLPGSPMEHEARDSMGRQPPKPLMKAYSVKLTNAMSDVNVTKKLHFDEPQKKVEEPPKSPALTFRTISKLASIASRAKKRAADQVNDSEPSLLKELLAASADRETNEVLKQFQNPELARWTLAFQEEKIENMYIEFKWDRFIPRIWLSITSLALINLMALVFDTLISKVEAIPAAVLSRVALSIPVLLVLILSLRYEKASDQMIHYMMVAIATAVCVGGPLLQSIIALTDTMPTTTFVLPLEVLIPFIYNRFTPLRWIETAITSAWWVLVSAVLRSVALGEPVRSTLLMVTLAVLLGAVQIMSAYQDDFIQRMDFAKMQCSDMNSQIIEKEKKASEELLYNTLPRSVVDELKAHGMSSYAKSYPEVTVMFVDIVGFTELSGRISPAQLVQFLNMTYQRFDRLCTKYGCEKIKTIGDAYMAVGGMTGLTTSSAPDVADLALGIIHVASTLKTPGGLEPLKVRIGIHTGPVVAGVIGKRKFSYDLWGDTVNIASRMESHGIPGSIQCSKDTYKLLKNTHTVKMRGSIVIKGAGPMVTYIVASKKGADDQNRRRSDPENKKLFSYISTAERQALMRRFSEVDCAIYELSTDEKILCLHHVYHKVGIGNGFNLEPETLTNFFNSVKDNYQACPYHNFDHGVEVVHGMFVILDELGVSQFLTSLEILSLLVVGLCVDVDHPGLDNNYQCEARTELAVLYNDTSVLENHHAALCWKLISSPGTNISGAVSRMQATTMRKIIVPSILNTDMSQHDDFIARFKGMVDSGVRLGMFLTPENRDLMFQALVKSALFMRTQKAFPIARTWSSKLGSEKKIQTSMEFNNGYTMTKVGDDVEATTSLLKNQVVPLYYQMSRFFPPFETVHTRAKHNLSLWEMGTSKSLDTQN